MQPTNPLSLRRNFSWTFLGNAVYAACQWGMLMVLAKLGSPEMVGQFTLGLAVSAPVFMFTNLQLRNIQATDAKRQYLFGDYLALRLIATGVALLVILGITLVSGYRREILLIILLVGLAKAFESISDVFYGFIQHHERMDKMAIALMIKGPLSLILLGLGVYLSGSVVWGVVGLATAWLAVLVGYEIKSSAMIFNYVSVAKSMAALQPRWHLQTLAKLAWLALPMGFVSMLVSLNTNIPRYLIEQHLGEGELGIFASMAYLIVLGRTIIFALGQSATPRLAKYYAAGNRKVFLKLLLKLMGIGALLGLINVLIAYVAGEQILTLIYNHEFAKYSHIFLLLMIAAVFVYADTFVNYALTATRHFKIQVLLILSVVCVTVLACFWLIPSQGLVGAAFTIIMAASTRFTISLVMTFYALSKI